jgi:hypothetical protein
MSGYFAFREIRFSIFGATAEATITNVKEYDDVGRRGRKNPKLAVYYTYTDKDGQTHQERDAVPLDWPDFGPIVNVEYLPGVEDSSRLEGHSSKVSLWMFLACCVGVGFVGYKLHRAVTDPPSGRKRR